MRTLIDSSVLIVAILFAASGCVYDGTYIVRGKVSGIRGGLNEPVPNAIARIEARERQAGIGRQSATDARGRFQLEYSFGGMGFLFFRPGDGQPVLEIAAPGYKTCRIEVREEATPSGVTRRPCPDMKHGCFDFDVLLASETPGDAAETTTCH